MNKHLPAQVIGIASGKGGVGKTTVSVNLAVALAATGKRVMLFDADLSLDNAQIALGCRAPYNMSHFLSGEKRLDEIVVTSRQGVKLVPGASGLQEMAALNELQMARIVQEFSTLEDQIDYLIVDMAAGISPMVMTLLSACSRRFVVVQDDPSSIADAYGTIKVMLQDYQLDEIYLIPNAVQSETEGQQLFDRINRVCARFLERTVQYLGSVERDDQILQALKKFQSVLEYAPSSAGARDFRRLAERTEQLPKLDQLTGGVQFFVERLARTTA
jgi:flagellar biosynthesis protein FlhG